MTTIVDTAPASNFTIVDNHLAETIFVVDGPIESGFQTTELTFFNGTLAYIVANKTAVTIDGGAGGDALVFDNPHPATGMLSLTVQNLGAGSTLNGGHPNPNAPLAALPVAPLTAPAA